MRRTGIDPILAFAALGEKIFRGTLPPVVAITASSRGATESFFGEELIRLLKERIAREKGFELFLHDPESEEFKLSVLCDDLQSPPLFSRAKILIVRRADALFRRPTESKEPATPLETALSKFLKARDRRGVVLCTLEKIGPGAPFFTWASKEGAVVFEARKLYSSPPPWIEGEFLGQTELDRWIELRAKRKKISLTPTERHRLAERFGSELASLENELEKFALLGRDPNADTTGIPRVDGPKTVVEAALRRDLPKALVALDSLYRKGFTDWSGAKVMGAALFPILCANFFQEIRTLLHAKLCLDAGRTLPETISALKLKPFAQRTLGKKVQRFSTSELRGLFHGLLQLECEVKRGFVSDPKVAFERFLVHFGSPKMKAVR